MNLALKTNENLEFAIITGCLRISRESIFTGLNNLDVNTALSESFADTFGFTQPEVDRMLSDYGIADKSAELEQEGYSDITVYGICFYKKECLVEAE